MNFQELVRFNDLLAEYDALGKRIDRVMKMLKALRG